MQGPRRGLILACALLVCASVIAQSPILLVAPDGGAVDWDEWLSEMSGYTAVVFWAAWSPEASQLVNELPRLTKACSTKDLDLVLVDTQEPMNEARPTLDDLAVLWLQDRHGALLKHYRVTHIPALVIVSRDASVVARLAATPEAVYGWRAP